MSNNYQGNMRGPGQKNRGRGGRPNMMGGGNQGNRPRPQHRSQNFDSSGPSVKIRGNAYQVFERYIAMAREASSAGDRVAAENLYQHAEHYYRIMQANGEGQQNQMGGQGRPMTPADTEMNPGDMDQDGQNPQTQPPVQYQPQQPQQHNPQQHNPQQHNPLQHNPQPHNPQHYQQQPQQARHASQPYPQPQPVHQPQHQPAPMQPQPQPPVQSQPQPSRPRRRRRPQRGREFKGDPERGRELTNERPRKGLKSGPHHPGRQGPGLNPAPLAMRRRDPISETGRQVPPLPRRAGLPVQIQGVLWTSRNIRSARRASSRRRKRWRSGGPSATHARASAQGAARRQGRPRGQSHPRRGRRPRARASRDRGPARQAAARRGQRRRPGLSLHRNRAPLRAGRKARREGGRQLRHRRAAAAGDDARPRHRRRPRRWPRPASTRRISTPRSRTSARAATPTPRPPRRAMTRSRNTPAT